MEFKVLQPTKSKFETHSLDPKTAQLPPSVVKLLIDVAPAQSLLVLAQVSRGIRRLATADQVWRPILDELGVSESAQESLIDPVSATNVLDRGYVDKSPYKTFVRISNLLSPYYEVPETISEEFASPLDQVKVLNQTQKFAVVDSFDARLIKLGALSSLSASYRSIALDNVQNHIKEREFKKIAPYAQVLEALGEADSVVMAYMASHELLQTSQSDDSAEAQKYFYDAEADKKRFDLLEFEAFLTEIARKLNDSAKNEIDILFPPSIAVWELLFSRVVEDVLVELIADILSLAKVRSEAEYLKLVPVIFECLEKFIEALEPSKASGPDFKEKARNELYNSEFYQIKDFIQSQRDVFVQASLERVSGWNAQVSEREHETEKFLWSSVPRQSDKSNFLSSFKRALYLSSDDPDPNSHQSPASDMSSPQPSTKHALDDIETPPVLKAVGTSAPTTEFEAQVAVLISKLQGIETLFNLELTLGLISEARAAIERTKIFTPIDGEIGSLAKKSSEGIFVDLLKILSEEHIRRGFDKALDTLRMYDPKKFGRLVVEQGSTESAVEPLAIFAELVNIGDLIQQTIHVFFEEELAIPHIVDKTDFAAPSVIAKRKFEQLLDDHVSEGLSTGIDVLMDQIDFVLMTEQLGSDFFPLPGTPPEIGPTNAAKKVVTLVKSHISLLVGATEKSVLEVFEQEVGLRLYNSLCKHMKRKTISLDGAITLISDINFYYNYILSLRQRSLYPYFEALKQIAQLYLIAPEDGKQLGHALSDLSRFNGVVTPEELVEFMEKRQDWAAVRGRVEKVLYGFGECIIS